MRKTILLLAALASLAACSEKSEEEVLPSKVSIEALITRATEVNFEQGDKIGIKITKNDGSVYASNALLTYDGNVFTGDLDWYADSDERCSVRAFYPYSKSGFPSEFTVGSDQTSGAGAFDLMLATKADVKPQEEAITMVFEHQLSQVTVNIDNSSSIAIESVTLTGLIPSVKIAEDGTSTPDESVARIDIQAEPVTKDMKYRAIVVPQETSFGIKLKSSAGGYVVGRFSDVTMKAGYTYSINAKVTAEGVSFSLAGEIQAWNDGGTIEPDRGASDDYKEIEGGFIYHGSTYRTVKLSDGSEWMADPMAYVPEGQTVSSDPSKGSIWYPYSTDGTTAKALTDEASVKAKGYLYSYPALLGTEMTEENFSRLEGVQGICPAGWHVPARAEWLALCGYSNKSELLGESSPQTDKSAIFWNTDLDYANVGKFNEGGFNFALSGMINSGKYNALAISSKNSTVESFYGNPAVTYIATSSANKATTSYWQMFCAMTTFTASAYPEGRVSLAYASHLAGVQLRCTRQNHN